MTDSHLFNRSQSVDELVRLARTDRDAFGQLVDRVYPLAFAYCVRRLLVRADAQEVASEVFLKAATGIRALTRTSEDDFRQWLFRIATNEINAQLRQTAMVDAHSVRPLHSQSAPSTTRKLAPAVGCVACDSSA